MTTGKVRSCVVFVALLLLITVAQPMLRRVYRQGRLPREAVLAEA